MKFPSMPTSGVPVINTVREIINYLRESKIVGISGGTIRPSPNGTVIVIKQPSPTQSVTAHACPFGEIIPMPEDSGFKVGIRGGVVMCGDKNFPVPDWGIDISAGYDGVWLVCLKIECESNRDDDGVIILPAVKTSAANPAGFFNKKSWEDGTLYDDNENPDASDGIGTVVVPLGKLTVTAATDGGDGAVKFEATGCGQVTVNQCGGTLTFTRG